MQFILAFFVALQQHNSPIIIIIIDRVVDQGSAMLCQISPRSGHI